MIIGAIAVLFFIVHFNFFRLIPCPFFQPDSGSYVTPALELLFGQSFEPSAFRTPGYPFFIYGLLRIGGSFTAVLLAQHMLHLLTAGIAGWIYYKHFNKSLIQAVVVTGLAGLLPRPLIYAHTIMSDNLYAALFIGILAFFLWSVNKKSRIWFLVVGVTVVIACAVRPVGVILVPAYAIAVFLYYRRKEASYRVLLFLAPIVLFSAAVSTKQRGIYLFASAGYLVEPHLIKDEKVRGVLTPIYETKRDQLSDHGFMVHQDEGPFGQLCRAGYSEFEAGDILAGLAREAILQHPFKYAAGQLKDLYKSIFFASHRPKHLYPKEYSLARGLDMFNHFTAPYPQAKTFIKSGPKAGALYPYERQGVVSWLLWPVVLLEGWMPSLAIVAAIFFTRTKSSRNQSILFLMLIFFHLGLSNTAGGVDGRYAIPLEPLFAVLLVGGVNLLHSAPSKS